MSKKNKPIVGGICLSYSEKSNINVWLLRFIVILATYLTNGFPILIYLSFWIAKTINEKDNKETKKEKNKRRLTYFSAIIAGSALGLIIGWKLGQILGYTGGDSIMSAIFALIGVPLGGTIGFAIAKRRYLKNQ